MVIGVIGLVLWLLSGSLSYAVDIQYELATTHISGVSDTPLSSVPGYGLVTLVGSTAAQIIWPVPSGCDAGQGQPQFTRITDPNTVTVGGGGMAVRTDLVFFYTTSTLLPGCYPVANWQQLRALVEHRVVEVVAAQEFALTLNDLNVMAQVRCPGATGGATCDSVRSSISTMNASYPSATTLNNFLIQVVTLRADALALKQAQCTATPGGPFC